MYLRKIVTVVIMAMTVSMLTPKIASAQELNESHITFIERFKGVAIAEGAKYDIPWETAMAIGLYESTSGTSYSAIHRHNFHGLSAGRAGNQNFASDEAGWEAFYTNLFEQECYVKKDVFRYRDDPEKFLEAITKAGYNPYPKQYLAKVGPFVKAVEEYRTEHGLPSSREYNVLLGSAVAKVECQQTEEKAQDVADVQQEVVGTQIATGE